MLRQAWIAEHVSHSPQLSSRLLSNGDVMSISKNHRSLSSIEQWFQSACRQRFLADNLCHCRRCQVVYALPLHATSTACRPTEHFALVFSPWQTASIKRSIAWFANYAPTMLIRHSMTDCNNSEAGRVVVNEHMLQMHCRYNSIAGSFCWLLLTPRADVL